MALIAMVLMLMGKKAYINLDYVALETVADGSYAVAIRQGNIDIKNSSITTTGTKAPIAKIYNGGELFFQCHRGIKTR